MVRRHDLYSHAGFEVLSDLWVKVGWNQKYTYTFTWLGRPIIQLPEDLIRIQEVIYQLKPDVIVETGVAHGGSLIFYATLCRIMNRGKVIGVDIEIRPNNRAAIENHELSDYIALVEGNSVAPTVLDEVRDHIKQSDTVFVILDSCHTRDHVFAELEAYSPLVTIGSYIVVTDGIMKDLHDVPRGKSQWSWDNPARAALDFLALHPEFCIDQPRWPFNESQLTRGVTHWPYAFLKRL